MAMDLTDMRQQTFLTSKRGGLPPVNPAKLTARFRLRSEPGVGVIWHCDCDCGGSREVPAPYFTSGRIKKCEMCVDPNHAAAAPRLVARRVEKEVERHAAGWYPPEFRATWRETMEGFRGARRLLFEATMGGRRRTANFLMQATDIVARVPDGEIALELGMFSAGRIAAARDHPYNDLTRII